MRRSLWFLALSLIATVAAAAHVDMKDPRRAVGADEGVRIDALLSSEFVSARSLIGITYQIQNLSPHTIAIADRVAEASFDSESSTMTLAVGSEVPAAGEMPRLVLIRSGEKKTLSAGAVARWSLRARQLARLVFVQIKVNVLRDAAPFANVGERQKLSDEQFDQWLKVNEAITLNAIPVRYQQAGETHEADASKP